MFNQKEKIRLIKPSRRKAPTEYNLQYKKWPLNKNLTEDYKMSCNGRLIPKALLNAPKLKGRLPFHTSIQTPVKGDGSVASGSINSSSTVADLSDTLRATSAQLHRRNSQTKVVSNPKQHYAGVFDEIIQNDRLGFAPANTTHFRSRSLKSSRQNDVIEQRFLEKNLSDKIDFLTMQASYNSANGINNVLTLAAPAKKDITFTSQTENEVTSPRLTPRKLYSKKRIPKNAWQTNDTYQSQLAAQKRTIVPESLSGEAPPSDNCLGQRKKKPFNVDGLDEKTLKKVYKEATIRDLQKINDTFKGVITSVNNDNTGDGAKDEKELTQEEENAIRREAFRNSKIAYNGPRDDSQWVTSYHLDYCLWQPIGMEDGEPRNFDQNRPLASSSDRDLNNKSKHYPSPSNSKERFLPKRTESEEQRILSEADKIEEQEFQSIFTRDGRPKMENETTSGSTYRKLHCQKPETPVWANKTMVSLGSGHWNLLSHVDEDWRLMDSPGNRSYKSITNDMEEKYKIKVFEPKRNEESSSSDREKPSTKQHRNTCKTEYMRTFKRLPLPKRKVVL